MPSCRRAQIGSIFSSNQKLRRKWHMFFNLRTADHFKYFKLIQLHLLKLASSAYRPRVRFFILKKQAPQQILQILPWCFVQDCSKNNFTAILRLYVSPYPYSFLNSYYAGYTVFVSLRRRYFWPCWVRTESWAGHRIYLHPVCFTGSWGQGQEASPLLCFICR